MIIRKALDKDLSTILNLNNKLFELEFKSDQTLNMDWVKDPKSKKYFISRILKDDGCALMAEIGKRPVGYLVGGLEKKKPYRKDGVYAELENMLILEDFRGQGIGTMLVKRFLKWCRSKSVESGINGTLAGTHKQTHENQQRPPGCQRIAEKPNTGNE